MKIVVIGAGQVGAAIVEALHDEHDLTVVDLDQARLRALALRWDITTFVGDAASRRSLQDAGLRDADLTIACTSRDEVNIIASILAKKVAPATKTIARTTNVEYLEVWRERQLDVDFVVSSELETAFAVSRLIGVPAARQTDVFADGQVQIVEFDVPTDIDSGGVVGLPLRAASIPADSKVVTIIRQGELHLPRGDESIYPGDRIVIIGSPHAAREWSAIMAQGDRRIEEVVVFGCGRTGTAIARVLLEQEIEVRMVEADGRRALDVAEKLPDARVFQADGTDPDFLERERIGAAAAAVFAMREDAKNHYAATLAKIHGVRLRIAVVRDAASVPVFEQTGTAAIDPRSITAEEIVRFAHDPRTQQVTMLEGDRYEILDIVVRPESKLANRRFRDLPMTGSLIGAIVRDGRAVFPHGDDMLMPGDRAILFTESARVPQVERAL